MIFRSFTDPDAKSEWVLRLHFDWDPAAEDDDDGLKLTGEIGWWWVGLFGLWAVYELALYAYGAFLGT